MSGCLERSCAKREEVVQELYTKVSGGEKYGYAEWVREGERISMLSEAQKEDVVVLSRGGMWRSDVVVMSRV